MAETLEQPTLESYPGAQSVSRALALLQAFDDAHPEWTVGDLSEQMGLNKTTTHRLLAALESEGFVARNAVSGTYRLGLALITLGGCALRANDLRTVCRPELEALAQATGETAGLEVLYKAQTLIVDEAFSHHLAGSVADVGMRLPLHATSTGKVLLAHQPIGESEGLLRGLLPALTEHTLIDPVQLRQALAQVRHQGYATAIEELEVGFVAVAAPVYDHKRTVIAALGVGGPSLRLIPARLPEMIAATQVAARQVSRHLGYRPG